MEHEDWMVDMPFDDFWFKCCFSCSSNLTRGVLVLLVLCHFTWQGTVKFVYHVATVLVVFPTSVLLVSKHCMAQFSMGHFAAFCNLYSRFKQNHFAFAGCSVATYKIAVWALSFLQVSRAYFPVTSVVILLIGAYWKHIGACLLQAPSDFLIGMRPTSCGPAELWMGKR